MIFFILKLLLDVLSLAILLRVLMTWVMPGQNNQFTNILFHITEPMLAPLRRIIPRAGMFDLTPLAAMVILWLLGEFLLWL